MTYVYIHIPLLSTTPFLHASREQIGTWIALYAYCASQENSGRIKDARNWSPGTWSRVTWGDTPSDQSPLWEWHGNDLILEGYDKANQDLAQAKRRGAKEGAKRRWKNATGIPTGNASPNAKVKESKRNGTLRPYHIKELGPINMTINDPSLTPKQFDDLDI